MADNGSISQDTVDAGIGGRISALEKRQTGLLARSEGLQQQQVDLATGTQDLMRKKSEETAPVRAQMVEKAAQVPDRTVKEEKTPDYQRPTMDPKEMHEAFGALMAASMLTGVVSRTPYNNVMTAMTGAMNGFMKADEHLVKESLATFDKNLTAIKEKNAQKRREVEDAWNKYKNDLGGLKTQLELIAGKYDDPLALQASRSKSLTEMQKLVDTNVRAVDTAVAKLEGIKERAESSAARLAEARARHAEVSARKAEAAKMPELDKETVDFYAAQSISGDNSWQVGLARGKVGQQLIAAVKDRIPQMAKELGLTPQDVGSNKAKNVALTAALRDREKFVAAGSQFVENMKSQMTLVEGLIDKGTASGVPLLNKWIQAGRTQIAGDTDVTALDVAIRGLAREHQRIVTGVTSNAQLHVSAQETADKLANRDMTAAQIRKSIGVMREEADNALKAGRGEVKKLQDEMRSLGKGAGGDRPKPSAEDRAWAKAHPEDAPKFKARFGMDP